MPDLSRSHLADMIQKIGPLQYYSARSMERVIGRYSRLIVSKGAPSVNAGNIMRKLARYRYTDTFGEEGPDGQELGDEQENVHAKKRFKACSDDPDAPKIWVTLTPTGRP